MMLRRHLGLGLLLLGALSQLGFSGLQQEVESDQLGFWLVLLLIVIVLVVLLWWSLQGAGRSSRGYPTTEEQATQAAAEAQAAAAVVAIAPERAVVAVVEAPSVPEPEEKPEDEAPTAEQVEAAAEGVPEGVTEGVTESVAEKAEDVAPTAEQVEAAAESVPEGLTVKAEAAAETGKVIEKAETVASTPDNLRRIEGIGPKVNRALKDMGITTFAQLAEADPEQLEADLHAANVRILPGAPETWPAQAALAAKGDWAGFEKLTGSLKGGRRVN